MTTTDEQFKKAQALLAEKKPKLDTKNKLLLYGYFKQSTVGPNKAPQPKKSDLTASYKWNAWKKVSELSQDEAKAKFVAVAKTLLPGDSKL
jgi:acyl-CoA-binding protein